MKLTPQLEAMATGPASRQGAELDDVERMEEELGFALPAERKIGHWILFSQNLTPGN